jgi:hypothetical protein
MPGGEYDLAGEHIVDFESRARGSGGGIHENGDLDGAGQIPELVHADPGSRSGERRD